MGMLGFPGKDELTGMFGYVTDEDRAKWEQQRAASDARIANGEGGVTARSLAHQAATPAMSFAERTITGQMHAAQTEERRNTSVKQTKRTFTTFEREEPVSFEERGPEY